MFCLSPYLDPLEQAQMAEILWIQKMTLQVFIQKKFIVLSLV